MRCLCFAFVVSALSLAAAPTIAAETCHSRQTQFGKLTHCVGSVLAVAGVTFGPEHLAATDDAAWCAAAGQSPQRIRLAQEPPQLIRTITITTGFAKPDAARPTRRIHHAVIETSAGYRGTVALRNTSASQRIILPKARIGWVRLTVLDTYPAAPGAPLCVSEFLINAEEFAN